MLADLPAGQLLAAAIRGEVKKLVAASLEATLVRTATGTEGYDVRRVSVTPGEAGRRPNIACQLACRLALNGTAAVSVCPQQGGAANIGAADLVS
jgi:hypothetical protein